MFVTGIGALCPLGIGMEEIRTAWDAGEGGICLHGEFGTPCGTVDESFDLKDFTHTTYHYLDRTTAFALAAVGMAMRDAGRHAEPGGEDGDTGLVLGTAWGCSGTMETFQEKLLASDPRFATPFLFSQSFPNSPASMASIEFGIRGYNTVYAGCRNAGFMAFTTACDAVRRGRAQAVFAVGTDALSRTVVDYHGAGHPVGEGAACLLLSSRPYGAAPVTVAAWGMHAPEEGMPRHGERISVRDNRIEGIDCGDMLAAAFPLAVSAAADRIRREASREVMVTYEEGRTRGWCLLRGKDA